MLFQKCKGQSMNFVEYYMLDVLGVITVLVVTLLYIATLCLKYLFRFVHNMFNMSKKI